ncbi:MAG: lipopolysaccharide biosynthesis protein [Lachnospiraceae bacterium]|nr:lipopolysaccharide biosynthesis protein [Lachnospiraceae bacterium]
MANELRDKVASSLKWKYIERFSSAAANLLISVLIARELGPEAVGLVAILNVFINISNVFIQQGFSMALIQKKDVDETHYSSVFWVSLLVSAILYLLVFLGAPFVAKFYKNEVLSNMLRVLAIQLFFGPFTSVQNAIVARKFMFKESFLSNVIATVISGIIGIALAYSGAGAWALIAQVVVSILIANLVLIIKLKWLPKIMFSLNRIKELFSFGSKVLISSLIDEVYKEIYTLIIGKKYSSETLGYYNKGKQFPTMLVISIDSSIQPIMLPAYAKYKDDIPTVKRMLRRTIKMCAYIVFPLLAGLAAVAKPMVNFLLTDQWTQSVPFMQIYCLALCVHPIIMANTQAINALGRSDIILKINIIKKLFGLFVLLLTMPFGVYAIAWGMVLSNMIFMIINVIPNKKLLNYGIGEQIMDILPNFLMAIIMMLVTMCWELLNIPDIFVIILQILTGIVLYLLESIITKNESFHYLCNFIKEKHIQKQ